MISQKISNMRIKNNMSQEELAELIGVSRQSIQKWESGNSLPTIDNLIKMSNIFGVKIDYLCKDTVISDDDGGRIGEELFPSYEHIHEWENYSKALEIEYRQCLDEGKDIECYRDLFYAVSKMPNDDNKNKIADVLFSIVCKLPVRSNYEYYEPDNYEEIDASRKGIEIKLTDCTPSETEDKILGGWYGRICGCLLGKPVEGIKSGELKKLLKHTGNYPMSRYIDAEDIPEDIGEYISFPIRPRAYPRNFGRMPADDDTNYIMIGYEVLKRYGRGFTSSDVARTWLDVQTKNAYCTAERVAYKNLVNGFIPPASGEYKNAYREWIGAQIRGDFFGYINPNNPHAAAEMAYRDARISHVKNGVYGEMWVSAMIAAAFGTSDVKEIIKCGLAEIPERSRLHEAVSGIIKRFEDGVSAEDCFNDIHSRWDENKGYDWCHTISNAEIVAASLLYGNGDYGKSVCMAVEQAFDTDCNGATVGSVVGVMLGYDKLPEVWTERICDTLESTLFGYNTVYVKEMAKKTMSFL